VQRLELEPGTFLLQTVGSTAAPGPPFMLAHVTTEHIAQSTFHVFLGGICFFDDTMTPSIGLTTLQYSETKECIRNPKLLNKTVRVIFNYTCMLE